MVTEEHMIKKVGKPLVQKFSNFSGLCHSEEVGGGVEGKWQEK